MSKTKVVLTAPTVGVAAGEEIEVDADTAKHLIANGNATAVSSSKSADKS